MTKRCIVLVLMVFVLQGIFVSAANGPEVPKKALKLVKKADDSLKKNKLDKAMELYNKAIGLAPEYGAAYFGIGRLYMAQKNIPEALKNLEKAVEMDKNNVAYKQFLSRNLAQLGNQAMNQRDFVKSNTYYLKLLAIPGLDQLETKMYISAMFQVGVNYNVMKKFDKSNKHLLQLLAHPAIEHAKKQIVIQAHYQVGINYYSMKKHDESVEAFKKMFNYPELETEFAMLHKSAYYMVGLNANLAGNHPVSIEHLGKFLELAKDSENHKQLLPLANFLAGTSHMKMLEKEVAKIKNDKEKKKVERIAELAKKHTAVETYLNRALELKPDLEPAYMHLGNYYYYCENVDKTREIYKTLIGKFPASPDMPTYKKFLEEIDKKEKDQKKKK